MSSHGPEKLNFTTPHHAVAKAPEPTRELAKASQAQVDSAILTALKLFSGVYSNRFQPNEATVAAWAIALEGLSPQEIAFASRSHVRNTSLREDGSCVGSWPPTPADILAFTYGRRALNRGSNRYV